MGKLSAWIWTQAAILIVLGIGLAVTGTVIFSRVIQVMDRLNGILGGTAG